MYSYTEILKFKPLKILILYNILGYDSESYNKTNIIKK